MQRVAGAISFSVSPATWAAALVVVAGWIAGAIFIAHHIASTPQAPQPQGVLSAPEPSQTPNRAAKAAREPFKQEALMADPSRLGASRRAPQDEASRAASRPPQDDASRAASLPPQDDGFGARAETGRASWYDSVAQTASGEAMDGAALTAAHRTLPFGSKVRVANLANGRSVIVRINDRGPFTKNRIIDVSRAAAEQLGMLRAGVARVSVTRVSDEVASASDETSSLRR